MKTKMPLYLVEFGMQFNVKNSTYTLVNTSASGMYEAKDKFGLLVEFNPCTIVYC